MLDVAGVLHDCAEDMQEAVRLLSDFSNAANVVQAFSLLRNSSIQMRSVVASLTLEDPGFPQ